MAPCNGLMGHLTLVRFATARQTEKVNSAMPMVTRTRAISSMTRPTDMESIFIMNKCKNIEVNGKMICSTVMEERSSVTILFTKATSFLVKSMDKVGMFGLIRPSMKVSGKTMR